MNDEETSRVANLVSTEVARTILRVIGNLAKKQSISQGEFAITVMTTLDLTTAKVMYSAIPPELFEQTTNSHCAHVLNMLRNAPTEDNGLHMPEPHFNGKPH